MVDLPKKKVGIIACSGEELAEGNVTRLAALKVLEQLRPADTVTICLPLFLAGGEGDRAFAKFYPTITVDGCHLRCASKSTELYSGKPAVSLVVSELVEKNGLERPQEIRWLDEAGKRAVDILADQMAEQVDLLLGRQWNRRMGQFAPPMMDIDAPASSPQESVQATCSCGSGIPIQKVMVNGQELTLIGLPVILQRFKEAGKAPAMEVVREILDQVKIYNPIPTGEEDAFREMLQREYTAFYDKGTAR